MDEEQDIIFIPPQEFLNNFKKIKRNLFLKKNLAFLGSILCSTDIIFTENNEYTAKTDGEVIHISYHNFCNYDDETRLFILGHVLWHIAFMHPMRMGKRDPMIWEIASDIIVNRLLLANGFIANGLDIIVGNEELYQKYNLDSLTTEEIYELIYIFQDKNKDLPNDLNNDLDPDNTDPNNVKIKIGGLTKIGGRGAGDIPGEILEIINSFLKPQLKFGIILKNYFSELIQTSRSFRRPSRRIEEFILPSNSDDEDKLTSINVYIDSSGSLTDEEIKIFNSEIKSIKNNFNPEKITLISFDTKIRKIKIIKHNDKFDDFDLLGRGGTCLIDVFNHINNNKPSVSLIFTDLDVSIPTNYPKTPLIWLCTDPNQKTKPKYGKFIHVNTGAYK